MARRKSKNNKENVTQMKESKIRFENEQERPIQIILKEKNTDDANINEKSYDINEVMEEKPLQNEENNTPDSTRQDISPIEKISIIATIVIKAIGKGLVKAFIWITNLFKKREEVNETKESERKEEPESV